MCPVVKGPLSNRFCKSSEILHQCMPTNCPVFSEFFTNVVREQTSATKSENAPTALCPRWKYATMLVLGLERVLRPKIWQMRHLSDCVVPSPHRVSLCVVPHFCKHQQRCAWTCVHSVDTSVTSLSAPLLLATQDFDPSFAHEPIRTSTPYRPYSRFSFTS